MGVELLDGAGDTPESRDALLALLPPAGEDGRPVSEPDAVALEAASAVVRFCDPSMFPRLRAIADACEDEDEDEDRGALIGRRIAARLDPRNAELSNETIDVLPAIVLDGVVRAADGRPVPRATVALSEPEDAPVAGEGVRDTIRSRTDSDGRFHLRVPVGRRWHLTVAHPWHPALVRRDLDLRAAPAAPLDLTLPHERPLRGRVLDTAGRPFAGATVLAKCLTPFATEERETIAAADGTFEFPGLDADALEVRLKLHLHAPGAEHDSTIAGACEIVVRPGDPPVELRAGPGR